MSDKEFVFPRELVDRIASGNVVVFAGAGISTENPNHCNTTFYDEVRHELGEQRYPDFPSLMENYCKQVDGRIKLIHKIRDRIEYFSSFRGFRMNMTRFHRSITPLYMIDDIITTNWDNYFEEEAGFVPFVYDQDLALLEGSRRRLIKIHGSITNYGSIVATTADYKAAFTRLTRGPLGAYLKSILSTKTIIYTGYSLRDPNYLKIAQTISKMMGPLMRQSYFVSPDIDEEYLKKTKLNLIPIQTGGSYFFEQFREIHNKTHNCIVSEDALDDCEILLSLVNELHHDTAEKFISRRNRLLILVLSYQDGLQDALMRVKDRRNSGEYHNAHHVQALVDGYENKVKLYATNGNYWDACYCRGYQNGLIYLLAGGGDIYPPPAELIFDENLDTVAKAMRFPQKRLPVQVRTELENLYDHLGQGLLIPEHMPYV